MLENIEIKVDEKKWANHPRIKTAEGLPESEHVTDNMLDRRNSRVAKPYYNEEALFNNVATRDAIRHYAWGAGDTNPLFTNYEYAKKTKFGKIIAPPTFLFSVWWGAGGGGFTGVHGFYSGGDWECFSPIYEGTNLKSVSIYRDVVTKKGRMTGGNNIYIAYGDLIYLNADTGEVIAKEYSHRVKVERGAAGKAGKERGFPKPAYTKEDWLKILELYDKEEIRGSNPRYWEDVNVGDDLKPMIKGPLSVRDEVAWLMGVGSQYFKAHKRQFEYESRHPKILEYVKETGEADIPELVHILDHFARGIGVERAYDYGCQRMAWLCNYLTNWMGDDGFLWKMRGDERAFNQVGDITLYRGKVVNKYIDDGKCCVDIDIEARNQRDQVSMPTLPSTVILPSKQYGPAVYPKPSADILADVKAARPLHELIKEGGI